MALVRKCPKCGLDLTDPSASKCPVCGSALSPSFGRQIWIGASVQFAFLTIFMTVFHFPKILFAFFGGMILIGALISSFLKQSVVQKPAQQRPLARPVPFRVVSICIALCAIVIVSTLLFGFVMFMDSWDRWHRYEAQPYHRSEFQVEEVYRQRSGKSVDVYARGMVEGQREWMSLRPYLHRTPRTQQELEATVPAGVVIPIYFFPSMTGRGRVEVYSDLPPAEASHRAVITTVNNSLIILAISVGLLFVFRRILRTCYVEPEAGSELDRFSAKAI